MKTVKVEFIATVQGFSIDGQMNELIDRLGIVKTEDIGIQWDDVTWEEIQND